MLELLTRSKIRNKLILLFFGHQDQEYYLSEIAHLVNTSAGTTQRELNKLRHFDLIHFNKRAGLNFYSLNKRYPLLTEVESIIRKTLGTEDK